MKNNKKKKTGKGRKNVKHIKVIQIRDRGFKGKKKSRRVSQKQREEQRKRLRLIMSVVSIAVLIISAIISFVITSKIENDKARQAEYSTSTEEKLVAFYEDYKNEIPKLEFNIDDLNEVEDIARKLFAEEYKDQKQKTEDQIARLKDFAKLRDEIAGHFDGEIIKSDTDEKIVEELKTKLEAINESYRNVLNPKYDALKEQYQTIADLRRDVREMFTDDQMQNVRNDLTRAQFEEVKSRVGALPQRDIVESYAEALQKADDVLKERQRIADEARKKAEEERKRREAEIAAAWHVLNVPYWSQNGEGVKNGCEAASLLMGLQYKGYLKGMNLRTYAEQMPKSDDPHTGFRGQIFESAGSDAPFWIAPAPLAAFGRSSSGNQGVQNVTGYSLDQLDAEVAKGNPVIIYLTFTYVKPNEWRYDAPMNLHVMLLTGYNSKTGVQRTTDPYTIGGKRTYDLPKKTVESIYNATGKRAVVIR